MRYHSELDPETGRCYFNPQQDIVDHSLNRYIGSIRNYQDFMAFLYFSYFVNREEKKEMAQVITGLERLRQVLAVNVGYHPDACHPIPTQNDYQALVRASSISKKHPILGCIYAIRQSVHRNTLSQFVDFQMMGGHYFQRWQQHERD